jgi:hypothetical protein
MPPERQRAVDDPVVRVHHVGTFLPDYPGEVAHPERIRNWRMVQTVA